MSVVSVCAISKRPEPIQMKNTIIQRRDLPDSNSINHSKERTNLNTAGPATETGARTFRSRRAVRDSRLEVREGDHQTRPDSRSSVAHAARVQLSHRSWIRLNTLRHSRGTCQSQSRVCVRASASASEQNRHPCQSCVCVGCRGGWCVWAHLRAGAGALAGTVLVCGAERTARRAAVRLVPALVQLHVVLQGKGGEGGSRERSAGGAEIERPGSLKIAHLAPAVVVPEAVARREG